MKTLYLSILIAILCCLSVGCVEVSSPTHPSHSTSLSQDHRSIKRTDISSKNNSSLSQSQSTFTTSLLNNRYALVIGNANYQHSPLSNPANDAHDMAQVLRSLDFEVTYIENASQHDMEKSIQNFGEALKKGGVGLFYFAGHGLQVKGQNYLIPIGADITTEMEVKYEAVNAGRILDEMDNAKNDLNIVILDACRNNPYARSFRSSNIGLAKMDSPKGTLIAYSTSPGSVAFDGMGRNSPYTESLIKHINTVGLSIEQVFKKTRIDVAKKTSGKQITWESTSLTSEFFFATKEKISKGDSDTDIVDDSSSERIINVNVQDNLGWTPLMEAAHHGNVDVGKVLLKNGANPNLVNKKNATALIIAAMAGQNEFVSLLIKNKANINHATSNGLTALSLAIFEGHETVAKNLIENGADINCAVDFSIPLYMAAKMGNEKAVKFLVSNGAIINGKDEHGQTALMAAAYNGNITVVKVLVENGADVDMKDNNGNSALNVASRYGHSDIVHFFLNQ